MKREIARILLFLAIVMSLGLTGCQSMKAKPSEGAGFVPAEQMSKMADLPFHGAWVQSGVDWKQFKTLYIKDVNTKYLMEANWWQQSVRREDMNKDVAQVAFYMKNKFEDAFRKDPQNRFQVINSPAPGSLTLEMALTELVPSHVVLEALSIAAPYGSGVAVQAAARETGAKATVAFEGRLVDNGNQQVLALFADREQGKVAPINLKALTWYGEAYTIIDEWAAQFVQIANRRPGEIVKDSSPFTLKPW